MTDLDETMEVVSILEEIDENTSVPTVVLQVTTPHRETPIVVWLNAEEDTVSIAMGKDWVDVPYPIFRRLVDMVESVRGALQ